MNKQILIITILFFTIQFTFGQKTENKDEDKTKFFADSIKGVYIPINLEDCIKQIDSFLNDSLKNEIKGWSEDEFSANAHFGMGMWIHEIGKKPIFRIMAMFINWMQLHMK